VVRLKIQIAVPRWFLLLVATGFALAFALAVFLRLAVYMLVVVAWFAAGWILFARWSRAGIGRRREQALARGEPRPYVELKWPRSVETLARTWVVLFVVSALTGLILLIVAAIELRFG
jgi:hypothetical protein